MKQPGKLVKINDTYMHVYQIPPFSARRKETIVFLSGYGTECPVYDFKPLWHRLAGQYNMAVVERPGYGWSGQTKRPRDIDTILEETREALRQADITGPFIPAAHSLSGLEAIYWAQKYPDEIQAIIGLDMAVPGIYDSMEVPKLLSSIAWLAHGLRWPVSRLMVKNHPAVKSSLLNKEEQAAMKYIISKQLLSKNMIDEAGYVKENASKVAKGQCPLVPLLCCLSNDKKSLKQIPSWGKAHREYFSASPKARFLELQCGHYVHREAPEIIAKAILELAKAKQ